MGIPKFYNRWVRLQPGIVQKTMPRKVTSIMFDTNAVIHKAAQRYYAYGDFPNERRARDLKTADPRYLEQQFFVEILGTYMHNLIAAISPPVNATTPYSTFDTLIIAIDGVAPLAKINQQASRRIRAAMDSTSDRVFDSNSITPGTEFMINMDKFFVGEKRDDKKVAGWIGVNSLTLPRTVIYSSHMVPGEGEHKILQMIREGKLTNETEGAHMLYGSDADLIMLCMLAPLEHIYLVREDFDVQSRTEGFSVVSIDNLKDTIRGDLKLASCLHDFVIMTFLIGNDFLPHQHAFEDVETTMDTLLDVYKVVGLPLVNVETGELILPNLALYLTELSKKEPELLTMLAGKELRYPSRMLQEAFVRPPPPKGFSKAMNVANLPKGTLDYDKFRDLWYQNAFAPKGDLKYMEKLLPTTDFYEVSTDKIVAMCQMFITGMAWVYTYYTQGTDAINNTFIYRHHYAPLLSDLAVIAGSLDSVDGYLAPAEQDPVNPIYQLLAVLPKKSKALVPVEVRVLLEPESPIADRYPDKALIERDGLDADWQGIVLLPFVDIDRIIMAVANTAGFTEARAALFTPVNDAVIVRPVEAEELLKKQRAFQSMVNQEKTKRFGTGAGGAGGYANQPTFSGGRGRGRGGGRGGFHGGRGFEGGRGRGRGRGFQEGGRGTGRGRGRGRGTQATQNPVLDARKAEWRQKDPLIQ